MIEEDSMLALRCAGEVGVLINGKDAICSMQGAKTAILPEPFNYRAGSSRKNNAHQIKAHQSDRRLASKGGVSTYCAYA
jgi:hypothetical protein